MATSGPANRVGSGGRGYVNPVPNTGDGVRGTTDSGYRTLKLLARILIYVAVVVFVVTAFMSYVETLWMKAEIKREAKELRKLKEELRKEIKHAPSSSFDSS